MLDTHPIEVKQLGKVDWPTPRGSKGKGTREVAEPVHHSSMTGSLPDMAGIYYESMIGDDYSLQRAHMLRHKRVNLLKSGNPFELDANIGRESSKSKNYRTDSDAVLKSPSKRRFSPPPVKVFTAEEIAIENEKRKKEISGDKK